MSYCSKCGAKLAKESRYCPSCGTTVDLSISKRTRKEPRRPLNTLVLPLIILVVVAVVIITFGYLPNYSVEDSWRGSATSQPEIDTLILNLNVDIAHVQIFFEDLSDESGSPSIILDAEASAKVGLFTSSTFLGRFKPIWHDETQDNTLEVTIEQEKELINTRWPPFMSPNVTYNIRIDYSIMNTTLDIKIVTGGITLETRGGVTLNSVDLEVITGRVKATLIEDTIVSGNMSLRTIIGVVELFWNNVIVAEDTLINTTTATGGVHVEIIQEFLDPSAKVTLKSESITGGVDLAIDIQNNVSARIVSSVFTGGISILNQSGFLGGGLLLQSNNYPSDSIFDVTLKATTGGIDINAEYKP